MDKYGLPWASPLVLPTEAEPGTIQLPSSCRVRSTSNGPSSLPNSGEAVLMKLSDSDVFTYYVLLFGLIYCPDPPCGIDTGKCWRSVMPPQGFNADR
jgi:hypothetical protein